MTWLIEEYQTLVVGALGFGGVILTLRHNARLQRERLEDELRHERQTLRAALTEELKINRNSLESNVQQAGASREKTGAFAPTESMDDVYQAFIQRIGILSNDEVRRVMFAYLSLRTYFAKLYLIGVPSDLSNRHVHIPPENFGWLAELQKTLIGPVEEAIAVMEEARDAE